MTYFGDRILHPLQIYGLHRSVPGGLLLCRREYAGHSPDECIDCGVCEPECPVEAIIPDTGGGDDEAKWLEINTKFAEIWPNITRKGEAPTDADKFKDEAGKFDKYFSEKPGEGT